MNPGPAGQKVVQAVRLLLATNGSRQHAAHSAEWQQQQQHRVMVASHQSWGARGGGGVIGVAA
jgi:outer membrane biogenesis lipoprotein LolB